MNNNKTKLVRIRASELEIHPVAQRAMVKITLKKIKSQFNADAIGVLHAVHYARGGATKALIVDGQHRWKTLMDLELGHLDVSVMIHLGITDDAGACRLFLELNARAAVNPFDKFRVAVEAGFDEEVGISDIAKAAGLRIAPTSGAGVLACPQALAKVYRIDQGVTLQRVLKVINGAWGRGKGVNEGSIVEGLGIFLAKHNGEVDESILVSKLAKFPGGAPALIGQGKNIHQNEGLSLSKAIMRRIVGEYNKGRRVTALVA